jgi:hypothetical protein
MNTLAWLITGGFAKGYRTQVLGVTAALSAVGLWAVGDMGLADLIATLPVALGGLGLAALGAKVDDAAGKNGGGKAASLGSKTGGRVHAPFIGPHLGLPAKQGYSGLR